MPWFNPDAKPGTTRSASASRSRPRRLVALAVAALALIGLASPLAAQTPAAGVLRVGVPDLPPSKGNPFGALGTPSIYLWAAIYDALTLVNEVGVARPALALSWQAQGGTTWRFALRANVRFSNGEAVDAAAVVASFDFVKADRARASTSVIFNELANVAAAKAVDAMTVEFTTTQPDPILPNRIAALAIVPPKLLAEKGTDGLVAEPVGTGSYRLERWEANRVSLVANTTSWRPARIGRLEFIELPERPARVSALQSGQIDIAFGLSTDNVPQLEAARARADILAAPQVMSVALPFTRRDPQTRQIVALDTPFKDPRVRLALNYAVDRNGIAQGILGGHAKPSGQGATPTAFGYNPAVAPYPYDPARARALLAEAGFANGLSFAAEVVVGSFPGDSEIYQKMQQDMARAGIQVELKRIRFAEWLAKYQGRQPWESQAFGLSWNTAPYLDSIRPIEIFACDFGFNFTCDPEVQELIKQANVEFDGEKRKAILQRVHALNAQRPPAIFLVEQVDVTGVARGVNGFRNVNRWHPYHEMTVTR
jgi:peptide/nickel transport system substrate-binding protein